MKEYTNKKTLHTDLFVDGAYIASAERKTYDVCDPSSNDVVAAISSAVPDDITIAVQIALDAFYTGPWPRMRPQERASIMKKMASLIREHACDLAYAEARAIGKSYKGLLHHGIPRAARNLEFFAESIAQRGEYDVYQNKSQGERHYVSREPVGVGGIIIPWNSPIMHSTWKLAPCLAMGNTCVLKPPLWGALGVLQLGEIAREAGLPAGVLNILPGEKEEGEALVCDPHVSRVSFTGSYKAGCVVNQENAKIRLTPVSMELGGKAPIIVFEDADFDFAIEGVLRSAFRAQGQSCLAGTRLLVEQSLYSSFLDELTRRVEKMKIGDQFNPDADIGPLITKEHRDSVEQYIDTAIREGAYLKAGGNRPNNPALRSGNYLKPTIFTNIDPSMTIWKEEIFGPVLCAVPFTEEGEAVFLANNTPYGLSATIWTENEYRAMRVAEQIDAGMIWVNSHFVRDLRTPFGGRKSSGVASEGGRESLEFWSQPKVTCIVY